jgi:dipeptidyl aminopeptidase/acylaminoacyl peptidase
MARLVTCSTFAFFALTLAASSFSRPITYEDLIGITDISTPGSSEVEEVALSPDGMLAAIETRQARLSEGDTEIRWMIVPVAGDGGELLDAGDGGEPIPFEPTPGVANGNSLPQIPQWSPDSRWFFYLAKHESAIQLWRTSREGATREQLTRNTSDVRSFRLSASGDRVFFEVGASRVDMAARLKSEEARGFLYDERFAPAYGSTLPMLSARTASIVVPTTVWVYVLSSKTERLATDDEVKIYGERQAQHPSTLNNLRQESRRSRATAWLQISANGVGIDPTLTVAASSDRTANKVTVCGSRICVGHFKGVWISDDGTSVYFLKWTNGDTYGPLGLYRWRLSSREPTEILITSDLLDGCSLSQRSLICIHESSTRPSRLVAIDLVSGDMRVLYDPNPDFSKIEFGAVESFTWRNRNDVEGFGHLVLPPRYDPTKAYPLIVVQYRSAGFLRGGVGDEYPIHAFASKGMMVLSFDRPRHWPSYRASRSMAELNVKLWSGLTDRKFVLSVLDAGLEALEARGRIDPKRVGITGLSDGANTGVFALIHAPSRFAAASLSYTRWNPIYYYLAGPYVQGILDSWGLGNPEDPVSARQWREYSIALNAARISTPLLIQVSDAEFLTETQSFVELRRHSKPVEIYIFSNEEHIKVSPVHRYNIYKRNVQWFMFWLLEEEESDPVDVGQYERWRALRSWKRGVSSVGAP